MQIRRHKTAIRRTALSRPIQRALDDGLIRPGETLFDYGCGRGDDLQRLKKLGFAADGWDPVHRPSGRRHGSQVVNLGYVLNVIERPDERISALQNAWSLTERLLVVSARVTSDRDATPATAYSDGHVTRLGTFQKYFDQLELSNVVESALGEPPIPVAPGVLYVFRSSQEREDYLVSRARRRINIGLRAERAERLFAENRTLLEPLIEFLSSRGRLPSEAELPTVGEINAKLGSLKRAFAVVRHAAGEEQWDTVARTRRDDLLVYLALSRFKRRPKLAELSPELQLDLRALFGGYSPAVRQADQLLFSLRSRDTRDKALNAAPFGKLTPSALYIHISGLPEMPPAVRVYEGCARAHFGDVLWATLVKLARADPAVSYLEYPRFDRIGHPALHRAIHLSLRGPSGRFIDYTDSNNPPILHRKELFVPPSYVGRSRFARLTKAEERAGLLAAPTAIGTTEEWRFTLSRSGWAIRGHRLARVAPRETPGH